jgi:hypothetical protein
MVKKPGTNDGEDETRYEGEEFMVVELLFRGSDGF